MNKDLENSNVNEAQEIKLAENAFRELKPGEEYNPIMSSDINPREATPWSVIWGLVMVIIFSAATAYLGLKVGQVFEAAIPIAIIAVGISGAAKRKGALGENVINTKHRRMFGKRCCRRNFHPSRIIYIAG